MGTTITVFRFEISNKGINWKFYRCRSFFNYRDIKLNLAFALTNHGFFPVYIPDLSYDLFVNNVNVGNGTSKIDLTIFPGETKSLPFVQYFKINGLSPVVESIVDSDGIINLQVKGTGYFDFLGLFVPVPFESSKEISIKDEILKYVRNGMS